jgi:hypothetical protein
MKTKLTIIILDALVCTTNVANAQHRTHPRSSSHTFMNVYERGRGETSQYLSYGNVYESFAQGRQSYPNPDRELYVNRSCCS